MLDFGFYNMDCLEGMKQFPDNHFDLAIVDPPYGNAGGEWSGNERFGERFDRYRQVNRGGWHGKQKYHLGATTSQELAERGRRNTQKNYFVGRGAGKGVFRRTFPRLT